MLLKDICIDMHQGINTVADKVVYMNKGIPIIQSKNITSGFLDLNDVKFLCEEDYKKYKEKYQPNIGDLLISNIGTIGKSIIVKEKSAFLIAWNIFILKIDSNLINSIFLKHYLDYLNIHKYYDQFLTGGTVKFVNKKNMENIPVPDLSIHDQLKIATNLEKISNMINTKKDEINKLNDLIKSQFVKMFGNQKYNEKNMTYGKIKDVADIYLGLTHTPNYIDNGVKFISAKNTSSDFLDLSDVKYISKEEFEKAPSGAKPRKGDILFSRVGSNLGHPVILDKEEELCTFVSLGFFRTKKNIINEYLKYWMKDDFFYEQVRAKVSGGGQPNLNTGWLKEFKIIIPPIDLQNKFADFVKHADKQKFEFEKQLKKLEELQASLMQEYFG